MSSSRLPIPRGGCCCCWWSPLSCRQPRSLRFLKKSKARKEVKLGAMLLLLFLFACLFLNVWKRLKSSGLMAPVCGWLLPARLLMSMYVSLLSPWIWLAGGSCAFYVFARLLARSLARSVALRICLRSGACLPYISPAACMANEMQMSSPPIWLERSQRNHFSKPSSQWIAKWSVSCKMGNPPPLPLPCGSHKGGGEGAHLHSCKFGNRKNRHPPHPALTHTFFPFCFLEMALHTHPHVHVHTHTETHDSHTPSAPA